jgi:Na+-transporting methylmalonyl-CoA/oxaloacetate decarboxylase gamma subunit
MYLFFYFLVLGIRMMSEDEQNLADEKSNFDKHKKKKQEEVAEKQKSHEEL